MTVIAVITDICLGHITQKNLQGYSIDSMGLVINPIKFCSYGFSDSWSGLKLSDDPVLKVSLVGWSLVVGLVAFLSFYCISYGLFSLFDLISFL